VAPWWPSAVADGRGSGTSLERRPSAMGLKVAQYDDPGALRTHPGRGGHPDHRETAAAGPGGRRALSFLPHRHPSGPGFLQSRSRATYGSPPKSLSVVGSYLVPAGAKTPRFLLPPASCFSNLWAHSGPGESLGLFSALEAWSVAPGAKIASEVGMGPCCITWVCLEVYQPWSPSVLMRRAGHIIPRRRTPEAVVNLFSPLVVIYTLY